MKKILYYTIGVASLALLLIVTSCVNDPTTDSSSGANAPNAFLSVEEAQVFFDESFASLTRSGSTDCLTRGLFPTGEYAPLWSDARTSENQSLGSVDIPIMAEYQYRAIRSEFKNGRAHAYMVGIEQKLIVVKSKDTNETAQYILTLIPDKEYYRKNESDFSSKFLNSGDKGGYSGYALYTYHGTPIRLNKYRNGEVIYGLSTICANNNVERDNIIDTIANKIDEMSFQYTKNTTSLTRSGLEDNTNNWHVVIIDGHMSLCYCLDENGNITCDNELFDPCDICNKHYCECARCMFCDELGCWEKCQTCPYSCLTPNCTGTCWSNSDLCQFGRCDIDACVCCKDCEGECKNKCTYCGKCTLNVHCGCCPVCEGPCITECKDSCQCHNLGICTCL